MFHTKIIILFLGFFFIASCKKSNSVNSNDKTNKSDDSLVFEKVNNEVENTSKSNIEKETKKIINLSQENFFSRLKKSYFRGKTILIRFVTREEIKQKLALDKKEGNGFSEFYTDWLYYQEEYFLNQFIKEELEIYSIELKEAKKILPNQLEDEVFAIIFLKKSKGIFYFKQPILEPYYYTAMAYFLKGGNLSFDDLKKNTKLSEDQITITIQSIKNSQLSLKNLKLSK